MNESLGRFGFFQAIRNIFSNTFVFVIQALINFWYTPFLVFQLGNEIFSFIPLATSITNYFSIFTSPLSVSAGRHITVELEKGNIKQVSSLYNTNYAAILFLVLIISPLGGFIILFSPKIFTIPYEIVKEVQILFMCVFGAFLIKTYGTNYSLASFARNRFDLYNLVLLGARLLQMAIIIIFFNLKSPDLIYVGFGAFFAAILGLFGNYYLWQRLLPSIKISLSKLQWKNLKLLSSTGVWSLAYQIGFVLFLSVDVFIANKMLDLNIAGMYGALLVIPKNLRIFSLSLGGVWGPSMFSKYSRSDTSGLGKIIRVSTKITGLTLALLVGLICGFAKPFLTLWLGEEYSSMTGILILLVFFLPVNLIDRPFSNAHLSLDKLKVPALVTLGFGLCYPLFAVVLAGHYGVLGIVVAGVLCLTLNYSVFFPIYTAIVMRFPWWYYLRYFAAIVFSTFLVSISSYVLSKFVILASYWHFLFFGGIIFTLYLLFVYLIALNVEEKEFFVGVFSKFPN